VVADVSVRIPSAKLCAEGALLITHWGLSGPAILRLSSYAARMMEEHHYQVPVSIHWVRQNEAEVQAALYEMAVRHSQKQLTTCNPFGLQQRLWNYLVDKALTTRSSIRCQELNKKDVNRLVNVLTNDHYHIA
jgi:predicted flavoprotein YhiN